jgi:Flp pilus assembly protein TadD
MIRRKFPDAVEAFQTALRLQPNFETAQMNLRISLAMQGRYQEAAAGMHGKQAPAALNNVGFAAMVRGDYKSAEAYLVQALDASPSQYETASRNLQHLKVLEGQATDEAGKP